MGLLAVALFVTSIETVLDIIGGIASPAIAFLFPGVFYLAAKKMVS